MAFELPKLKYAYDALEPHIDARTMEIHHSKHHQGYTNNLNNAIAGTDNEGKSIENILSNLDMKNMAVRNNGGGFYNHSLFWEIMNPEDKGYLSGELMILKQLLVKLPQHNLGQVGLGFVFTKAEKLKCAQRQIRITH